MSSGRRFLLVVVWVALPLALLELGLRGYLAYRIGPSAAFYGMSEPQRTLGGGADAPRESKDYREEMSQPEWVAVRSVAKTSKRTRGYRKYFPNQTRYDIDVDSGERFEVAINSRGFRGADFRDEKPPGVVRVVTLGGSSTFGYYSRDDDTYPAWLERVLNERRPDGPRFEVINLGIPHLDSAEIRALFAVEAAPLEPDVVTFYEGNNDAKAVARGREDEPEEAGAWGALASLSVVARYAESLFGDGAADALSEAELERRTAEVRARFLANVAAIREACAERGILFVVANQQKNSQTIRRADLAGLRFADEVERMRRRLEAGLPLERDAVRLLAHADLMQALAAWAERERVPFVDTIAALDGRRDVMVSTVHLSPEGNRRVAEVLADAILAGLAERRSE